MKCPPLVQYPGPMLATTYAPSFRAALAVAMDFVCTNFENPYAPATDLKKSHAVPEFLVRKPWARAYAHISTGVMFLSIQVAMISAMLVGPQLEEPMVCDELPVIV